MILQKNRKGEVLQFKPSHEIFLKLASHKSPHERIRKSIARAIRNVEQKQGLQLMPIDYEAIYASYEMMFTTAIKLAEKMDLPDVINAFIAQDHERTTAEILQSMGAKSLL